MWALQSHQPRCFFGCYCVFIWRVALQVWLGKLCWGVRGSIQPPARLPGANAAKVRRDRGERAENSFPNRICWCFRKVFGCIGHHRTMFDIVVWFLGGCVLLSRVWKPNMHPTKMPWLQICRNTSHARLPHVISWWRNGAICSINMNNKHPYKPWLRFSHR